MIQLTTSHKVAISGVALAASFAFGRYSAEQNAQPNVVEHKEQQVKTQTEADKDVHENTKTVITKEPDGKTVTVIQESKDTVAHVDTDKQVETHLDLAVQAPKHSTINISGMVGLDTLHGMVPVYGIMASKELIGPITVGAFGLSNGTVGVTAGLNF